MSYLPERLSVNEICVDGWSSVEFIERCANADVRYVSLWRDRVASAGSAAVRSALDSTGVEVSSLCRAGLFTAADDRAWRAAVDDSRAAIEEAAQLGTRTLVIVAGPVLNRDLITARRQVFEGLEAIVDDAAAAGVRLAVEPFHPMLIADRSVIVTLEESLRLAEDFDASAVGIALDAYHVFWDPDIAALIERAGDRIECYQISDWILPIEGGLSSRGLPGTGSIDLQGFESMVAATGYTGPIEVEVFSTSLWQMDPADALDAVLDSYHSLTTAQA